MVSVDDSFKLEVRDDAIIVTFAGTSFSVVYRMPPEGAGLAPMGFSKEAHATAAQIGAFLSVASHLATEKAIVEAAVRQRPFLTPPGSIG